MSESNDSLIAQVLEEVGYLRAELRGLATAQTTCNVTLDKVSSDVGVMGKDVIEIRRVMQGTLEEPSKGLVSRVECLEESRDQAEAVAADKKSDTKQAKFLAYGALLAVAGEIVVQILQHWH